jgi:tetratricopeptide (TPR) repeat protein
LRLRVCGELFGKQKLRRIILAALATLAFGVAVAFYPRNLYLWFLFFLSFSIAAVLDTLQRGKRLERPETFGRPFFERRIFLDVMREEIFKKTGDLEKPPDFTSISESAGRMGGKKEDLLAWLGEGTPFDRGLKALVAGDFKNAARLFEENAARQEIEAARSLFILGSILFHRSDDSGAIRAFERAVALHPDFPEAWLGWGKALERLGDERGAAEKRLRAETISSRSK